MNENPTGRELAVQAAGATFAAFLAKPAGPAAEFLAAAITPLTTRMARKIDQEWRHRSTVIFDTAVRTSRIVDPAEFLDAITSTPEMIGLTEKILFAATVTGNQAKLRALGAILGTEVGRRGSGLDETNLLVDALTDLEAPHVVVMNVIAQPTPPDPDPGDDTGWFDYQVQEEVEIQEDLVLAILSMLTRHGLARTMQNNYGARQRFGLTTFGQTLADYMNNAASEPL